MALGVKPWGRRGGKDYDVPAIDLAGVVEGKGTTCQLSKV